MAGYGTVVGYFPSQASAESAINALKQAGFEQHQIGVATRSLQERASSSSGSSAAYNAGKTAGGAWDSIKNFFGGNAAEPYAGEATKETFNDHVLTPEDYGAEDVHASLAGLSVPGERARYFGHRLGAGTEGAVVTVNAGPREQEAIEVISANGGDIGNEADSYDYGADIPSPTDAQNIQLFGEVLRVHKDRISRGEVRVRKEVTTTTQTVEVPVTREELVVERVPVSGQVPAAGATFNSEEIRIPLSEERATVSKHAVVQEEVRIGKKQVTEVETLDEQVRSEELKIDQNVKDGTSRRI
jgi:uncharacterized protein (TIGR02271 family)